MKGLKDLMTQTDDHAVLCVYKYGYILFITLLTEIARLIEHKSDHRQSSSIDADPNRIHGPNTAQITIKC